MQNKFYVKYIKNLLDYFFAVLLFIISSPILIGLYITLYIVFRHNPIFIQIRPGKNEKLFYIYKFKTMTDNKDSKGRLLPDSERITLVGKIVRKSSLDELLQLINILKGEMSFIGPRPLLKEYLPLYNDSQKKRHYVKPGITGWAQVNGRNSISWQERLSMDVFYVENISFLFDIKILFLTFFKVIRSEGINASASIPMEKFEGTEK